MHPPISEPDLVTLLEEADAAASRLWRRVRLPRADLDDLRQDLLLDLIRRLPAFDARRGTMGTFAGIVLCNQTSRCQWRSKNRPRGGIERTARGEISAITGVQAVRANEVKGRPALKMRSVATCAPGNDTSKCT